MMRFGISRFVGSWVSASGYRLAIKKVSKDQASVDLFEPSGDPIRRLYMKGALSLTQERRENDSLFSPGLRCVGMFHANQQHEMLVSGEARNPGFGTVLAPGAALGEIFDAALKRNGKRD